MSDTINIGGITVSKFYLGESSDVKIYLGTTKLYPHLQEPCFAVVDDISTYTARTYVDVYETSSDKWYKLNNLNAYEEYGVYGSSTATTYYDGKLVIQDDYEYQYSGSSWVNVGEVSGSTLPNVSFVLNYNAKNYDATNSLIPQTNGQTKEVDATCNYNPSNIIDHSADGYISVVGNTRLAISGGTASLSRDNTQTGCTMTIVSKALGKGSNSSNYSLFTCRGSAGVSTLCWMYRQYTDYVRLHGKVDSPTLSCSSLNPSVLSVKTYYDGGVKSLVKNWTDNTTTGSSYQYYNNYTNGALFCDYLTYDVEFWRGDFYWLYMSHEVLTDEQIQQVIDYNEEGGGQTEYPVYYDEIQDPPNNLTFSSMTEAESYECPWVGMIATIDGVKYIFSGDSISGYEWVEHSGRLPQGYTEVEYIRQNSNYNAYINTGVIIFDNTTNTYTITTRLTSEFHSDLGCATIISCERVNSPYDGLGYRYKCSSTVNQLEFFGGNPNYTSSVVDNGDGTRTVTFQSSGDSIFTTDVPLSYMAAFSSTTYGANASWRHSDSTIYSATIVKNGVTVREFVPAKRDSDDKYGLYDLITNTFYASPNGNNFIGGQPV